MPHIDPFIDQGNLLFLLELTVLNLANRTLGTILIASRSALNSIIVGVIVLMGALDPFFSKKIIFVPRLLANE